MQTKPSVEDVRRMVEEELSAMPTVREEHDGEDANTINSHRVIQGQLRETASQLREIQLVIGGQLCQTVAQLREDILAKPSAEEVKEMIGERLSQSVEESRETQ